MNINKTNPIFNSKAMRFYLTSILMFIFYGAFSQIAPVSVNRGGATTTQVDQFLSVSKRLGIPTSPTDNLEGVSTPQNTAKIIFNTTLGKLRVYIPTSQTWRDATPVDLGAYYSKAEVDSLLSLETLQKITNKGNTTSNRIIIQANEGLNTGSINQMEMVLRGGTPSDYSVLERKPQSVQTGVQMFNGIAFPNNGTVLYMDRNGVQGTRTAFPDKSTSTSPIALPS